MAYQHWSYDTLHRLCMEAFQKFGFTEAEADIIQDVLLTAGAGCHRTSVDMPL